MKPLIVLLMAGVLVAPAPSSASASEWELTGHVSGELRGFLQGVQFPAQLDGAQPSLLFRPELSYRTDDERHQIQLTLLTRLDTRDPERTHFDLREAYWRYVGEGWDVLLGLNQVFWGVAESRHLVDVVNQADFLEDIDGEDKLGQPMAQFGFEGDWGRLGIFVMPGFRERTFPGRDGRLRLPLPVSEDVRYESSAGSAHVDYALRYAHYFGDFDVGLSLFHGTSREPRFEIDEEAGSLTPHYDLTSQIGLDLQYTRGAWLFKLEGLARKHREERFAAAVAGVEYTFYQTLGSSADVGVLFEYLRDGRGPGAPLTIYDDDLFVGTRIALNDTRDTSLLAGAVIDRDHGATAVRIEAERRLSERVTIEVESRLFFGAGKDPALSSLAQDDYAVVRVAWFF